MKYRLIHKSSTFSTNDDIKDYFDTDEPEGLVVIAEHQTNGRGVSGDWEDDGKSLLLFSLLLRPYCLITDYLKINYCIAQAVIQAINIFDESLSLKVKWPNDVFLNRKKICGILQEGDLRGKTLSSVALGVGLNVNVKSDFFAKNDLENGTSLYIESHRRWDKTILLNEILNQFALLYEKTLKSL